MGPLSQSLPSGGPYDYVIVTSSALASSFQPLLNQKLSEHLTATIVTTDYIYANYTGTESHANDPMGAAGVEADQIRQFIADAYDNWGTRWVLLGGDMSVVPMREVSVQNQTYTDNALPTDMYYSCPHGPWNNDGNSLWGQADDGAGGWDIDMMPEVNVGRAPVSSAAETANFVNKTILYETTPAPNPDQALFLGEQLDSTTYGSTSGQIISNAVLPAAWQSQLETLYDTPTYTWSASTLISDLNASPALVNSLGHSNATLDSRLTVANVAALTNAFPYFMYSQGCDAGALDQADPCIAEEQVIAPHAAFAVVMNTGLGWYQSGSSPAYSHYYALSFWDAVFNEGKVSLGEANSDSKEDNLDRIESNGNGPYRWSYFSTTLFGDPETQLQVGNLGEISGTVWNDANGNGVHDAGEGGLVGQNVFLDLNQNGTLDSGTANLTSSDVPKSIAGQGTFTSSIAASNLPGVVTNVKLTLDITYPYDVDLTAYLVSPSGTKILLFSGVGGFAGNFTQTTFDDGAATGIDWGSPPYTGTFSPEGALSKLIGEQPNGTWTLQVTTQYGFGSGTLNSWSLQIASSEPHATTYADGSYDIGNLPDGTYQVRLAPQAGWTDTNPASGMQQVTVSGGAVVSNVNFLTVGVPPPLPTINQAAGQADPTNTSPINFTVVFNQAVSDFVAGDVTLGGTAGATTAIVTNPSLDHMTYNVAVSGMTGDGTVVATIAAGVAHNAAGRVQPGLDQHG